MKHRNVLFAAVAAALSGLLVAGVGAQSGSSAPQRRPAVQSSGAETRLVGINLYDDGLKVVQMYGPPNQIQLVGAGNSSIGPVGGGATGGGGLGARGGGAGGGGGGGAPSMVGASVNRPGDLGSFGFADSFLMQGPGGAQISGASEISGQAPPPPGGGGAGGGGFGGGGIQQAQLPQFTRWVYNRSGSKYAFVIDKYNRVVQIEAIGISDPKVTTRKGVRFGTNFATIIKSYGSPDGYDINGDTIVVRYLQNYKVAFRLSRLGRSKTHTVTGVVVAGGKA